jgi:hypothetical protein
MRPEYISYDSKQREALLSQLGNFSPAERDVFHRLCQNWQERIPYNRIVAFLNNSEHGTTADLFTLMEKLRKARVGILRTVVQENSRSREAIVLTRENGPEFFLELADELFTDMLESITNPLPLLSSVRERIGEFPPDVLQPVPPEDLSLYFSGRSTAERPLAVATVDGDALLVSQPKLRPFVTVAILKMRYYLANTTLLGLFAKYQDTSLLSLKQQCAGKEPGFWLALTKTVFEKRRDLESQRSMSLDGDFFHAAALLKNLIESQISESQQKKQEEESRKLDLDAIAMAIKESPEEWLEQSAVSDLLDAQREKYADSFEKFREEFYERFVQSRGKNSLPKVVLLNKRYIHRDNVFPTFLNHFRELENDLAVYFALLMEDQLKSGSSRRDPTFVSLDNFNAAIAAQVEARSPYVAALIAKPSVLAEGIILYTKQHKLAKDIGDLKQRLAVYFDPETMQPLPLNEWFDLRPLDLFEKAFEKLPILRRIWIRITGKYESFRGRYLGQSTSLRQDRGSGTVAGRGGETTRTTRQDPRRGTTHPADSRRRGSSSGGSRGGRGGASSAAGRRSSSGSAASANTASAATKRAYSKKQVDSAWDEFGSTIKKGP